MTRSTDRKAYKKKVKIDNGTKTAEVGAIEIERDFRNNLFTEPLAQDGTGDTETLIMNLNRVKRNWIITAKIDDEFASKVDGAGSKEDLYTKLEDIYLSQERVTLTIDESDSNQRVHKGFLKNLNSIDAADRDSSAYELKIEFVKGKDIQNE